MSFENACRIFESNVPKIESEDSVLFGVMPGNELKMGRSAIISATGGIDSTILTHLICRRYNETILQYVGLPVGHLVNGLQRSALAVLGQQLRNYNVVVDRDIVSYGLGSIKQEHISENNSMHLYSLLTQLAYVSRSNDVVFLGYTKETLAMYKSQEIIDLWSACCKMLGKPPATLCFPFANMFSWEVLGLAWSATMIGETFSCISPIADASEVKSCGKCDGCMRIIEDMSFLVNTPHSVAYPFLDICGNIEWSRLGHNPSTALSIISSVGIG